MILHLLHDDKVCNRAIATFEDALPNENIYICFADQRNLQYISDNPKIIFVNNSAPFSDFSLLQSISCVIIHYLDDQKMLFIKQFISDPSVEIVWSLWGGDIYDDILQQYGYNPYFEKKFVPSLSYKSKVVNLLYKMLGRRTISSTVSEITDFIENRVNVLLSTDAEFKLIQSYLKTPLKCQNVYFPIYYPIEDSLGELFDKRVNGNNIMIGNSASYTNNHLYAFGYLERLNTQGRIKIVPVSYSGSPEYISHIESCGRTKWGDEFHSIRDFMPLADYNKLMLSSSVFIYGNWRQEAVGNIVMALYLGAKVFLSERSPLLSHFSSYGIKLFVTERMTQNEIDTPISEEDFENNRRAIMNLYSREVMISSIKSFFAPYLKNALVA